MAARDTATTTLMSDVWPFISGRLTSVAVPLYVTVIPLGGRVLVDAV